MADFNWNFKEESGFESIPAGDYRVRISSAEKAVSQRGNDMLILKLDVNGFKKQIWHYIVFMPEHPEITNRNLTGMFDSFGISHGDFNIAGYAGKTGAAHVKIDENNYEKIQYFLTGKKKDELPAWSMLTGVMTEVVDDEDMPF